MRCKQCKFGCNRSVIKGNLHEKKCAHSSESSNVINTDFPISYSVSRELGKEGPIICYLIQTFATKTVVHDIIRKDKNVNLSIMKTYEKVEIQPILRRFRNIEKSNY